VARAVVHPSGCNHARCTGARRDAHDVLPGGSPDGRAGSRRSHSCRNWNNRYRNCYALGLGKSRNFGRDPELPPSEWSIDYDSLDQGRDNECL
jgi:hypothetical protein